MSIILEGEPSVREKIFRTSVEFFLEKAMKKVSLRQLARESGSPTIQSCIIMAPKKDWG